MKIVGNEIILSLFVMGSKAVGFEKPVEKFFWLLDEKLRNMNFHEVEDMKESIKADYENPFTELLSQAAYDSDRVYSGLGTGVNHFKEDCAKELKGLTSERLYQLYKEGVERSPRIVFEYLTNVGEKSELDVKDVYGGRHVEVMTDF
jgi:hypothetical protein